MLCYARTCHRAGRDGIDIHGYLSMPLPHVSRYRRYNGYIYTGIHDGHVTLFCKVYAEVIISHSASGRLDLSVLLPLKFSKPTVQHGRILEIFENLDDGAMITYFWKATNKVKHNIDRSAKL